MLEGVPQSFRAALASFGVDYPNGGHDKEAADSFPASDPPSDAAPGHEPHHEAPMRPPTQSPSPRRRRRIPP